MKFREKLYVSDSIIDGSEDLVQQIQMKKPKIGIYLLTLPANPENQLDIVPEPLLLQSYYGKHEPEIVGIAGSRKEAFALVEQMTLDAMERFGTPDIRMLLKQDRGDADD